MLILTQEERKALVFLLCVFWVGIGVNFWLKRYAPVKGFSEFSRDLGKIDLNNASRKDLEAIPGIGEKLSERIIAFRKEKAGFFTLEELKKVPGITASRYEKIKKWLYVK